jgi:nucleoid-associated protein YejK
VTDDSERAIQLVTNLMRELPELYAARNKAFKVEFFTDSSTGRMLVMMQPTESRL